MPLYEILSKYNDDWHSQFFWGLLFPCLRLVPFYFLICSCFIWIHLLPLSLALLFILVTFSGNPMAQRWTESKFLSIYATGIGIPKRWAYVELLNDCLAFQHGWFLTYSYAIIIGFVVPTGYNCVCFSFSGYLEILKEIASATIYLSIKVLPLTSALVGFSF